MSNIRHSDKANKIIDELKNIHVEVKSMHGKSRELIAQLLDTLRNEDKLTDKEIKHVLFTEINFLSRATIYNALEGKGITREYERKPLEDREVQQIEPEPVPTPVKPDSDMTIEELRERNRQNLVSQGKIPDSVYREPDKVEPRPEWNKDKMDTVQEQSFRTQTMKVEPNVPVIDSRPLSDSRVPDKSQIPSSEWLVHNEIPDYTVTTQLQIHNGTGNNIGQFTVDVVCHCYPMNKTVELEPIDKTTIRKVH